MYKLMQTVFSNQLEQAEQVTHQTYSQNQDVQSIPKAIRNYLAYCGFTGREKITSAQIKWKEASLKLSEIGPWKPMVMRQNNFLPEPIRLTYMKTQGFQFMPMEAIDSYLNGNGQMRVNLFYLLNVVNCKGKEMDQAELVTILAETMLIPHYALQHYIKWEIINEVTVMGTIFDRGIRATGIFYFNENHQVFKFETNDRFFTGKNGKYEKTNWTVFVDDYTNQGTHHFPGSFRAVWNRKDGDYEYFKGRISSIEFGIKL